MAETSDLPAGCLSTKINHQLITLLLTDHVKRGMKQGSIELLSIYYYIYEYTQQ